MSSVITHVSEKVVCSLLTLHGFNILLDCGWNDEFKLSDLAHLTRDLATKIDCILISHSNIEHLGALPWFVSQYNLQIPIFATAPVTSLAQFILYETSYNLQKYACNPMLTVEMIDNTIRLFRRVAYSQVIRFDIHTKHLQKASSDSAKSLSSSRISATAIPAGHMLGSCLWKVSHNLDSILYVSSFNHADERMLDGSHFIQQKMPSVVMLRVPQLKPYPTRASRESSLINSIFSNLESSHNGHVILPSSSTGRLLEILLLLKSHWDQMPPLRQYPIYIISPIAESVISTQANTYISWMSSQILQSFIAKMTIPFKFGKYLHFVDSLDKISLIPISNQKDIHVITKSSVFILPNQSLSPSGATEFFRQMAENIHARIIFLKKPALGTLGHRLLTISSESKSSQTTPLKLSRKVYHHQPRDAEEEEEEESILPVHSGLIDEENMESAFQNFLSQVSNADNTIGGTSESSPLRAGTLFTMEQTTWVEDILNPFKKFKKNLVLPGSIAKTNNVRYLFPFNEENVELDEYGAIVNLDTFRLTFGTKSDDQTRLLEQQRLRQIGKLGDLVGSSTTTGSVSSALSSTLLKSQWDLLSSKIIATEDEFEVCCKVEYHPFDGTSSCQDLFHLLPEINPFHIILIDTSLAGRSEPEALASFSEQLETQKQKGNFQFRSISHLKNKNDSIELSNRFVSKTVHLSNTLLNDLSFTNVLFDPDDTSKTYKLSWVEGVVHHVSDIPATATDSKKNKISSQVEEEDGVSGKEAGPSLPLRPKATSSSSSSTTDSTTKSEETESLGNLSRDPKFDPTLMKSHFSPDFRLDSVSVDKVRGQPYLLFGNPKLRKIKDTLTEAGFKVFFDMGRLVVDNTIVIRKVPEKKNQLSISGPLSKSYIRCHSLIQGHYTELE